MAANRQRFLPYLALALGVLSLGISPFFIRWSEAPGPVTAFFRMLFATLILAPVIIHKQIKDPAHLTPRMILFPALGGLASTFDLALWSTAIGFTAVANVTLFNNMAPLWVALVAWLLFKERLRRAFWIGLVLTLAGAIFILGSDILIHPTIGIGDIMAVSSSFFYAGYYLATQIGRVRLDTLRYMAIMNLTCMFGLLAYSQIMGMSLFGYSPLTYLVCLGAALTTQVVGYFSIAYALGHLPASIVSPTLIGQPVLAALLAIPFQGEFLTTAQWIGGAVVLIGIYTIHCSRSESQPASSSTELPSPANPEP